jgi:hypothetical protein
VLLRLLLLLVDGGGKDEPLGLAVMEGLAPHHSNKH